MLDVKCELCSEDELEVFSGEFKTENGLLNHIKTEIDQFENKGYVLASLDSLVKDNLNYTAYIYRGSVFCWSKIGKGNAEEEMLSSIGFRDKVYKKQNLNLKNTLALKRKIVSYYEDRGYPFAIVRLDSVEQIEEGLKAALNVRKGDFISFDSLELAGNAKISYQYLSNVTGIKYLDFYSQKKVNEIANRLSQVSFVTLKKDVQLVYNDKSIQPKIELANRKASRFYGIVGVMPNNQTGEILITGDAKLKLVNSFGKGEELYVNWRRLQENTQDLVLQANYPFIYDTQFGVESYFKLYRRDTLFNNTEARFGVQYLVGNGNYIQAFVDNKQSSLISTKYLENLTQSDMLPYSITYYGLGFRKQKLNYFLNPTKGYRVDLEGSAGNKKIKKTNINNELDSLSNEGSLQIGGKLAVQYFVPIKQQSTILIAAKGGYVFGDNLLDNELYRIGGLHTLRGFNEESIFANSYSVFTLEYRYLLEQNSYLYAFADAAYLERKNITSFYSDTPYGFGVGVSFETKAGIFTINYALGSQKDNPIEFRSAKVHFGFVFL